MPFVIPNAIDTTGSNRFTALDQAEPDALDFQILGNRSTGVISGCNVTAQTVSNYTVAVSSGFVALNGVVYTVSSSPALSLPAVPSNNRFDLIVARIISGVVTITTITGPDSATNPSFPPTPSRMVTTVGIATNTWINPDTDIVLAAVYRAGASTITNSHIVDKRVNVPNTTSLRGDAVPPNTLGQDGDFYYKTGVSGSAAIYVKINGSWLTLSVGAGSGLPIGTVITWVSSEHPGVPEWLECDGSPVPRTGTYAYLYNVLDTVYGEGDGSTTFNLPDFRGAYLRGMPGVGESLGSVYGSDTTTLTIANLPQHNHPSGDLAIVYNGEHNHSTSGSSGSFIAGLVLRSSLANTSTGSLTFQQASSGITLGIGATNSAGGHGHSISGNTANTGSGQAININPRHYPVRYFIKYA